MKVSELIEVLKDFDPKTEVHFAYNYGDHWRTQVAPAVEEVITGYVVHSDYHDMPRIAATEDEVYDGAELEDEDATEVVILR